MQDTNLLVLGEGHTNGIGGSFGSPESLLSTSVNQRQHFAEFALQSW